ncbi:MAG: SLBB domain-containing protein [Christensenella sp.]|nr:SLBB domain-containing protein [Christensenella sp.]
MADLLENIRNAGVVGAGGAGFPTHVKVNCKAEVVIANGAECEPLLNVDQYAMRNSAQEVVAGLETAMQITGAKRGVICTKEHYHDAVAALTQALKGNERVSLKLLKSTYPAGDEQVMVYEVTGKVVPTGGLPLDAGAVVLNVSTLINVHRAQAGIPVTSKVVTVSGEVNTPVTLEVPIGTPYQALISRAGGPSSAEGYVAVIGGPCMGALERDWSKPVTKTTGGIIVLKADHPLVCTKTQNYERDVKLATAVCCQCSLCTQMCPRNALGLRVEPHKAMRAVANNDGKLLGDVNGVFSCCSCGLCTYYACNFGLNPAAMMTRMKEGLSRAGIKPEKRIAYPVSDGYSMTKLPTYRLESRLGVSQYEANAPFVREELPVSRVTIPLKMHIGAPSEPVVTVGTHVKKGDLIARIPEGKMGANIHASVDGAILAVDGQSITIQR